MAIDKLDDCDYNCNDKYNSDDYDESTTWVSGDKQGQDVLSFSSEGGEKLAKHSASACHKIWPGATRTGVSSATGNSDSHRDTDNRMEYDQCLPHLTETGVRNTRPWMRILRRLRYSGGTTSCSMAQTTYFLIGGHSEGNCCFSGKK